MPPIFKRKRRQSESSSSNELQTDGKLVTLNVADTKTNDFTVRRRLVFDLVLVTFRPVEGVVIDKILLKDTVFWQKGHGRNQCTCVRCYIKKKNFLFLEFVVEKGENTSFEYFYKDHYKWVSTNPTKYSEMFAQLVELFYRRGTYKLNVNGKVDPNGFFVNKLLDAPFYVITPKPGYWVDRVVDGMVDIWEKNYKNECCLNAVVFLKDSKPFYCYLLVNESDSSKRELYFRKDGVTWPRVTKEEYINAVKQLYDLDTFNNKITLELSNPGDKFFIENFDSQGIISTNITPFTGFKVVKVTNGDTVVWNDTTKFVSYVNYTVYTDLHSLLCVFVRDGNKTNLQYYAKTKESKWTRVDKEKYDYLYSVKDNKFNTHKNLGLNSNGERSLVMSHFTNKYGLKINTYCCKVENSKGNMILVHGAYGHFLSDFATYNHQFLIKYENFKPLADLHDLSHVDYEQMDTTKYLLDNLIKHKECFEYRQLDGLNLFDTTDRFEYRRSFMEGANNMGYNIYGLDLISHGFSEALTPTRFYTKSFMDYIDDLLQFVDLVKRNKFNDTNQNYEDYKNSKESDFVDNKYYLVGYSMGSNVCMRTVNEYYKRTRSSKKFVDGVICLSGMYELAQITNPLLQRLAAFFISILSFFAPKSTNPMESGFDFTITYDAYPRFRDSMYASKKCSNKTLLMIAKATFDLPKNLSFYPDDLPTLLLNSVKDDLVNIEGARRITKYIKNSKLVELDGNVHGLPLSQYVTSVTPLIKDWLVGSL